MAWVRCCGGSAQKVQYPIDLLANVWDIDPTTAVGSLASHATAYRYMIGKTPKLKANATLVGTLDQNTSASISVYVEVSEDGNTWTPIISAGYGDTAGVTKTGSLSAYADKELNIRVRIYSSNAYSYNVGKPIYSPNTALLQIV